MCKNIWTFLFVYSGLIVGCAGKTQDLYQANWESLQTYECPTWFRDAKFGIYAHWGPYCVPAFPTTTDWYSPFA